MSAVPQNHLPPELVHAIVIRMKDEDKNYMPIKGGLASCSLTCRYWAGLVRPLLFEELTLRSGEDVSLLVAFLDADALQPTLSGCIRYVHVVENQASAGSPWSHQLIGLARWLPHLEWYSWTAKGAAAASDGQRIPQRRSPLPFAALPRTLPRSILPLRVSFAALFLSGLSLRSVRDLANFMVHQMPCSSLVLHNVTFAEETVAGTQLRRSSTSRSTLNFIRVEHGLENRDTVKRWVKISNILFATRGHERLDDVTLALVGGYLHLLLLHSGRRDRIQQLDVVRLSMQDGRYFYPLSEPSLNPC